MLILKLLLAPLLIAAVTLAGRRWGHGVTGWLAGLPLTSGPVSVLLALEQGRPFAARAAVGSLAGLVAVGAFGIAYAAAAGRRGWLASAAAGMAVCLAVTALLTRVRMELVPTFVAVVVFLALLWALFPARRGAFASVAPPRWDVPARMVVAAAFVVALTGAAGVLGPRLSGLLAPFPIFSMVLAGFAHRAAGGGAARSLLRGVVLGSFAFATFYLVVGARLERWGIAWTYAAATGAALLVNTIFLALVTERRGPRPQAPAEGGLVIG